MTNNLFISCADDRLREVEERLIRALRLSRRYELKHAGGAGDSPNTIIQFLRLPHIKWKEVILCAHDDCKGDGTRKGLEDALRYFMRVLPEDCMVRAFWFFCPDGSDPDVIDSWDWEEVDLTG